MKSSQLSIWIVLSILTFLAMVLTNFLANYLPIGGFNTGEISAMYTNLFVPAGFTFSIWGLIYLSLAILFAFFVFRSKPSIPSREQFWVQLGPYFCLSSVLNSVWIFCWHHQLLWLTVLIMIGLLVVLLLLYRRYHALLSSIKSFSQLKYLFPVSLYLGWICIALIANVSAFLVSVNWSGWGIDPENWAITMVIVGTIITWCMMQFYRDQVFALVSIWAFAGIISKRIQTTGSDGSYLIISLWVCVALLIISTANTRLLRSN